MVKILTFHPQHRNSDNLRRHLLAVRRSAILLMVIAYVSNFIMHDCAFSKLLIVRYKMVQLNGSALCSPSLQLFLNMFEETCLRKERIIPKSEQPHILLICLCLMAEKYQNVTKGALSYCMTFFLKKKAHKRTFLGNLLYSLHPTSFSHSSVSSLFQKIYNVAHSSMGCYCFGIPCHC